MEELACNAKVNQLKKEKVRNEQHLANLKNYGLANPVESARDIWLRGITGLHRGSSGMTIFAAHVEVIKEKQQQQIKLQAHQVLLLTVPNATLRW